MDENLLFQLTSGLGAAGRRWRRLVEHALGGYGVSAADAVPLIIIGRADGGMRQVTVAREVGIVGPSLVRLVDKLSAAGLLERRQDASDRRANTLSLTPAGRVLADRLEARLAELRSEVFDQMSVADMEAVLRFYRVLADASCGDPVQPEQDRP